MRRQYRNGGLTVALGRPSIAYTEGRCAGGGSEVNSGLYHRPGGGPARGVVVALSPSRASTRRRLAPRHAEVERRLAVGRRTEPRAAAVRAAARRGARGSAGPRYDVPRWEAVDPATGVRRAPDDDAHLPRRRRRWRGRGPHRAAGRPARARARPGRRRAGRRRASVRAGEVVVCAGAVQTPALLQRSGHRPPRRLPVGAPHGQGGRGVRRRGQRARRAARPGRCKRVRAPGSPSAARPAGRRWWRSRSRTTGHGTAAG